MKTLIVVLLVFSCVSKHRYSYVLFFFFPAEDGIRFFPVTGVQTCALPISVYGRGEPVDAITVVEELKRHHGLDEIGGPLYVQDLVESVPTPASAGYYARIVADNALLRRLIDAAAQIMSRAYAVPEDPRKAADEAEALVYAVSRADETEQVVSLRELVDESMGALEHIQQRDSAFAGVPTGFMDLDSLLSGLQKENLIIVAAR